MKYVTIPFIILLIFGKSDLNECVLLESPQSTGRSNMQNPVQLNGLERIYFERAREMSTFPAYIFSLLPVTLTKIESAGKQFKTESDEYQIMVRDYPIPIQRSNLWLREVIDHTHPRISKLWWAVYDNGRRSDIWYFAALPERTDNKLLPNYTIDRAFVSAAGLVAIRLNGSMFRPGGYWTFKGITLTFSPEKGILLLKGVINDFSILHGYHAGDTLDIITEQVVENRIEQRAIGLETDGILQGCGLAGLLSDEGWDYSWEELKQGAFCITEQSVTKITYRGLDEPSFIEFGWISKEK